MLWLSQVPTVNDCFLSAQNEPSSKCQQPLVLAYQPSNDHNCYCANTTCEQVTSTWLNLYEETVSWAELNYTFQSYPSSTLAVDSPSGPLSPTDSFSSMLWVGTAKSPGKKEQRKKKQTDLCPNDLRKVLLSGGASSSSSSSSSSDWFDLISLSIPYPYPLNAAIYFQTPSHLLVYISILLSFFYYYYSQVLQVHSSISCIFHPTCPSLPFFMPFSPLIVCIHTNTWYPTTILLFLPSYYYYHFSSFSSSSSSYSRGLSVLGQHD